MTTFVPLSQDTEGAVSSTLLGDWVLGIIKVRAPYKTATYYSQLLDQFQEVEGEQVIKESFQLFELLLSEHNMIFEFLQDAKDNGATSILTLDQTNKVETEVKVKYIEALKQVEEYFTVLMYMLQLRFTSSGQIEKAGLLLLKAISDGDTFLDLRLRLLQMLYNSIEPTLMLRVVVYISILEFASKHNIFHTIVHIVKDVESWMADWSIDKKSKIQIFHIIAQEFDKLGKTENIDATIMFCIRSIKSDDILYFDQLLLMPAVMYLSKCDEYKPIIRLIDIFIKGTMDELECYINEYDEAIFKRFNLPIDSCRDKLILLSLATLCQNESEITIARIKDVLSIDDIEDVIVNAINKGVLDALIDQKSQKVIIKSVMHREFSTQQLKLLHDSLLQWKQCVNTLITIFSN